MSGLEQKRTDFFLKHNFNYLFQRFYEIKTFENHKRKSLNNFLIYSKNTKLID